jgi:hypothetical protein
MDKTSLRRYTNLASLISLLKTKELTLLDPSKWEDKNDAHYLLRYAEKKGFRALYALCFTNTSERSHHWKVFSPGSDGVCITVNSDRFLGYLKGIPEIVHDKVEYKLIEDVESERLSVERLPFIKRYAFSDESEYRVIFRSKKEGKKKTHGIPFDVSLIERIHLSNSLPSGLRKPITELLRSIDGCGSLDIQRSTLNDNSRWKNASERAT